MLTKKLRFTKQDFVGKRPRVFFRGVYFDAAYVDLATTKYTCIISKKTLKRAVDRNRAKRVMMSLVAASIPPTNKTNKSIIFYPKKELPTVPRPHLQDEIKKLFDTLH